MGESEKPAAVHLNLVVDDLDAAVEAPPLSPPAEANGVRRRHSGKHNNLPDGCPVTPLGINGDHLYFLDAQGQLRQVRDKDMSRLKINSLFWGRNEYLAIHWPRITPKGETNGVRYEEAATALMDASAAEGVWEPEKRLREVGSWVGDEGELICHCGSGVWVGKSPLAQVHASHDDGQWLEPGLIGQYVYPQGEALPRPAAAREPAGENGPAAELAQLLGRWQWRRGEVDALLLLGWIGAAMLGGALKWRPVTWITGGRGTGKSTIHDVLRFVLDGAVISISDASAAGLWQKLGHATLPIAFDELEAEEDNRRAQAVVKLARQAASGGLVLRGGADHKASEFVARSCFLFSSINVPPLLPQDLSRIAILELEDFPKDAPSLSLDEGRLRAIGAGLRRRLADGWWKLPEALEHYRAALQVVGHSARGADQFGTLLACADLLLHDGPVHTDHSEPWVSQLSIKELAAWEDDLSDDQALLNHLITSPTEPYRDGSRKTVGECIRQAVAPNTLDAEDANRVLTAYGLRVFEEKGIMYLAVANRHQGLTKLLAGSHWVGRSGTTNPWVTVLRRNPQARADQRNFGGVKSRCTSLPLSAIASLADRAE